MKINKLKLLFLCLNMISIQYAFAKDKIKHNDSLTNLNANKKPIISTHKITKLEKPSLITEQINNLSANTSAQPIISTPKETVSTTKLETKLEAPTAARSSRMLEIDKNETVMNQKCENGHAEHYNICAYCPSNATFNKNTNKCDCNNPNEIISKITTSTDNKTYFKCVKCPANLIPNGEKTSCVCKDFENKKHNLNCTKYSINQIKYNTKDGTYNCNEPEHVLAYDNKEDLLKCYKCSSDANYDKDNNICICSKPDAKNPNTKIEFEPRVQDGQLVCNPNLK